MVPSKLLSLGRRRVCVFADVRDDPPAVDIRHAGHTADRYELPVGETHAGRDSPYSRS